MMATIPIPESPVPAPRIPQPAADPHTCRSSPDWRDGLRPGEDVDNDALVTGCPGCRADAERARQVAAWEDTPLDPADDLALIADYPAEQARLRVVQARIAAHPVFRVVDLIGDPARVGFLADATTESGVDDWAADDYFAASVCRCEPLDRSDGAPVRERQRRAARCRWCVLLDSYRDERHADTAAQVAEYDGPAEQSSGVAARLLDVLRVRP